MNFGELESANVRLTTASGEWVMWTNEFLDIDREGKSA